ncbi:MAG: putative rane protein, partial [Herbinix sp.]|nr:putative rane protein [Herbinix sp.]
IEVDYEATGEEEEQLDAILDQVDIETTVEDNQLQILFVKKDSDQNIWRWMKNEYKDSNYNLSVNLDITIPKTIKEFDLTTNLGDLSLNQVEGAIDAYTALGSITAKNVLFTGDSKLETSLGDINCSFDRSTKDKSELKLKTDLGNVKIDTNGLSVDYTEEKTEAMLTDSTELLIGGVSKLKADTALGKISVKE